MVIIGGSITVSVAGGLLVTLPAAFLDNNRVSRNIRILDIDQV